MYFHAFVTNPISPEAYAISGFKSQEAADKWCLFHRSPLKEITWKWFFWLRETTPSAELQYGRKYDESSEHRWLLPKFVSLHNCQEVSCLHPVSAPLIFICCSINILFKWYFHVTIDLFLPNFCKRLFIFNLHVRSLLQSSEGLKPAWKHIFLYVFISWSCSDIQSSVKHAPILTNLLMILIETSWF